MQAGNCSRASARQDFEPRIHLSDSDFAVITQNGALCDATGRLGPAEFETVMRQQIRSYHQRQLCNTLWVSNADRSQTVMLGTLKALFLEQLAHAEVVAKEQVQCHNSAVAISGVRKQLMRVETSVGQLARKRVYSIGAVRSSRSRCLRWMDRSGYKRVMRWTWSRTQISNMGRTAAMNRGRYGATIQGMVPPYKLSLIDADEDSQSTKSFSGRKSSTARVGACSSPFSTVQSSMELQLNGWYQRENTSAESEVFASATGGNVFEATTNGSHVLSSAMLSSESPITGRVSVSSEGPTSIAPDGVGEYLNEKYSHEDEVNGPCWLLLTREAAVSPTLEAQQQSPRRDQQQEIEFTFCEVDLAEVECDGADAVPQTKPVKSAFEKSQFANVPGGCEKLSGFENFAVTAENLVESENWQQTVSAMEPTPSTASLLQSCELPTAEMQVDAETRLQNGVQTWNVCKGSSEICENKESEFSTSNEQMGSSGGGKLQEMLYLQHEQHSETKPDLGPQEWSVAEEHFAEEGYVNESLWT